MVIVATIATQNLTYIVYAHRFKGLPVAEVETLISKYLS